MDLFAQLHDGYFLGVDLDNESKSVVLRCRTVDGRAARIRLTGVLDLCITNLRLGNIILFMKVFESIETIGREMIAALAQTNDETRIEWYLETLRGRSSPHPKCFLLQSSYGADAACVFTGDLEGEFVDATRA